MTWIILLIFVSLLPGCGREEVQVYRVAKETPPPVSAKSTQSSEPKQLPPGHPDVADGSPRLTWKLPSSWEELTASEMRVASFRVKGQKGNVADVSVIPLPGRAGGLLMNVNRWRGQVGQAPVTEEQLASLAQPVEVAGQKAELYEQVGTAQEDYLRTNILAAILNRDGVVWFFKMTGHYALVTEQKPSFIEFLKSLRFETPSAQEALPASHPPLNTGNASSGQTAPTAASADNKPKWEVPPGWQEAPAGQFLIAKYLIAGDNKAQAAVNISTTGGALADNINRWRGQLTLQPLADDEIEKQVQPLEVLGGKAMLIDMSGTDRTSGKKTRLIGAINPRPGATWYYKLMGDEQLVEREKAAFLKFVQTATYR